ncbi:MAG TPA: TAT-variant-translocated molybdopterin oxidoreductase [Phycisphaerae bacterium]|nr:TAT-variant-translocated molybdopterin oxidoreductase [Phycisphaerae bacterium]
MTHSDRHTGPAYWRSLDEFAQTPEFRRFVEAEFHSLAPELLHPATRRQFLKLMGASLALAGLAGCRWPRETIVPAGRQPAGRIPGVPVQYATAFELDGVATGLLVTSYDGRPIKIEGNDKHPFSRGKTNTWMQASILDLYDPDRSRHPVGRSDPGGRLTRTWDEFVAFARPHCAQLRAAGGAGLAVLSETSSSPSLTDMKGRFSQAFPQAQWFEYEPVSRDNERAGARLAFGRPYRTHLHLDKADVIVSFDSDFLMTHPAAVKYAGDFAARRRADDGTMNRLYVLENRPTVTGSMADHRYAVRSSQIRRALEHIASAVADKLGRGQDSPIPPPGGSTPLSPAEADAIAADLVAHQGRCVVIVGPQQPPEAHAAAHVLNTWLGAPGQTVTFTGEPDADRPSHAESIVKLTAQMSAGQISTLVILGGNPVYNAPADVRFADALAKVANSIHLSTYVDETSQRCTWHLPRAHYLESWGDALAWDGSLSIVQPLIEPLYGGRTPLELLALLCDDKLTSGYDIVRRTFGNAFDFGVDRARLWEDALHDGLVANSAWPLETPTLTVGRIPEYAGGGTEEIVFAPDYSVHDGRFANNAWLQEWPDPITKLTWDNAALVSPAQAKNLGVKDGDIVRIELATIGQRQTPLALELPVYVLPGHAEGSLTVPLGYGRGRDAGAVGAGAGFNAYALRCAAEPDLALTFKLSKTGRKHALVTTQDHHAIDSQVGRAETQRRIGVLVREGTLAEYQHEPDFAQHVAHLPQLKSLWQEREYPDHKWGLAIDLSACIGCSACVVACQAENNIPVVGKDEVALGREMHWIRIDRYFKGEPHAAPANVEIVHQPVTCTHCENAPCEQVCPVAATVHDEEGLNAMVYNRCIGTRYCSNNCPFKVRRFNWFYNHHGPHHPRSVNGNAPALPGKLKQQDLTDIEKLLNNPAVTVRSRGVMEKCTFCVQRIMAAKIKARNERWDSIPDGLITPACAQACPTDAIVFGDLNDPNSRVRKLHAHNRAYEMLAELNIKARTRYLAKLRNPAETKT